MEITVLMPLLFHPISMVVLIFIFLLHKFCFRPINSSSSKPLPPSPPKLPIFGNLLNLGLYPHITLATYARRHGPLFLLHLGTIPTLVVSSPEMARQIMKTHDLVFSNRPKSAINDKMVYGSMDVVAASYGEYWRQMKSICVLHMLSNKRVQSFRSVREEEIKLMIRQLTADPSMSVNLSEIVMRLANDVVSRVALGRKYGVGEGGRKRFGSLLLEFGEVLGSFSIRDFIPWLGWMDRISGQDSKTERVAKEFDSFLNRVIEEHVDSRERQNPEEHKDLVDVLLWIQRENMVGFPLETRSIKALILDMFVAGTDTSSTVMEWAMSRLLKHPRVMKKVQSEVREKAGERTYISEDELEDMHYLKAVIKETLRMHPPAPLLVPREPTQDIKLSGYHITAGTLVLINAWHIGRDPEYWPQPEEFRPERFLNNAVDFKGHDFQLIPFGAGRRGCPGISFATVIIELALANLLLHFEWSLPGGAKGEELDMTEFSGLIVHRKFPLLAVATPRTTS